VLCSKASIQRSWVQFEVGAAWIRDRPILPLCHSGLKPHDLPLPLSLLESSEISEIGIRRLYDAVAHEVGTNRKVQPEAMARHLAALLAAESSRKASSALQFERYIDIVIPPPGRLETELIPDATIVESNDQSLKLFGLVNTGTRTWREIVKAAQKTKDQRWLKELQTCIYLASNDEDFRSVQAVYHNPHGSYQPQLAKKEVQPDGACRFHVHLVETLVAPLTEVQNDFGLLATLLRLGLRFRYEVIQKFHRALMAAARAKKAPNPAAVAELRSQLRNAIEIIENDALSRGAENIDRASVVELFNCSEDQDVILRVQEDWDEQRARLFRDDPAPEFDEMDEILNAMRELNFDFMTRGSRRLHEMVNERWRPVTPSGHADARAVAAVNQVH
jgi:hypothetical protein